MCLKEEKMAIDLKYITDASLEEYFVDKETALPLSGGMVFFWRDVNRTVPKAIFTISGSAPNYTFVQLPNPMTLSGVGTPQDGGGNNVPIYYYPYDDEGAIDRYFVEVFSADGTPQFTREAWPPGIGEASIPIVGLDVINYIPNGQFLAHNNIPADLPGRLPAGRITQPITQIAQGGWTFERPIGTPSVDNVIFMRYGTYTQLPIGSPRYAAQVSCTGQNPADTFKNLAVAFQDVNKFASPISQYTFAFTAITNGSANFDVTLNIIKNFGTGGSPSATTTTPVATFTITNTQRFFTQTISFGENTGASIGTNDDDYVQLALTFPTNVTFNGIFTDFVLTAGAVSLSTFPTTTDDEFMVNSLAPPPNNYDGFSLGLPLILTKEGLDYDDSQVGTVYAAVSEVPAFGSLPCNAAVYPTNGYSPDGIPYARLQRKIMGQITPSKFVSEPLFGTGSSYITAYYYNSTPYLLMLATNQPGLQTIITDGAVPTGFTFQTNILGQASLGLQGSPYNNLGSVWALCNLVGTTSALNNAGTSTLQMNITPNVTQGEKDGDVNTQQLIGVGVISVPLASTYCRIATPTDAWRFWFSVDGVGTDPGTGGGTPVQVNINSNMDTTDFVVFFSKVLAATQVNTIQIVAGNVIVPNSYFIFYANSQRYYVWYNLNGTGIDPAVASAIGIPVFYTSVFTAQQIRDSTIFAINSVYFAVPSVQGRVIKGYDPSGTTDVNRLFRNTPNRYSAPAYIGSSQYDFLLGHAHDATYYTTPGTRANICINTVNSPGTTPTFTDVNIAETGTGQNDVKNLALAFFIKY